MSDKQVGLSDEQLDDTAETVLLLGFIALIIYSMVVAFLL